MEQCKGITKSGERCKNTRNLVNGYCRLHVSQSDQQDEPTVVNDIKEPDLPPTPDSQCLKENSGNYLKILFCALMIVAGILLIKNLKRLIQR